MLRFLKHNKFAMSKNVERKCGKTRNWCFTLNNYCDHIPADEERRGNVDFYLDYLVKLLGSVRYMIIGLEEGVTGTPHIQGYVDFINPRTLAGIHRLNKNIHWETRRGNWEQAVEYCKKEGVWKEYGEPPKQGERTDIRTMVQAINEGKTDAEILLEFEDKALRISGCLARARAALTEVKRNWEMDVRIYHGEPGSGKTRSVFEEFGADNVYTKMVGKWWDGYRGEQCVLIDDFDPVSCFDITFDFYLKLLDRYPMRIEYKGGSCQFYSKVIIFTSNFHPADWFVSKPNRSAFFRRVNSIKYFHLPLDCVDSERTTSLHVPAEHGTEVWGGNTGNTNVLPPQITAPAAPNSPTFAGIVPTCGSRVGPRIYRSMRASPETCATLR